MKIEFTLALTKHKDAHRFKYIKTIEKSEDVNSEAENACKIFADQFRTPVKCVKIKELKE